MKVVTYTRQTGAPKTGGGQFLSARLNAGAMTAPARASARQASQFANVGQQVADWSYKKAEIGADNEALIASTELDLELQQMQVDFLADPNMDRAEVQYQARARTLVKKYKSGMSNRLAGKAFTQRALQVAAKNRLSFSTANNERAAAQREVTLDADTRTHLAQAADLGNSAVIRGIAAKMAVDRINAASGDLGPEETEKRLRAFKNSVARDSLIQLIDAGAPARETIDAFRDGSIEDPVIAAARDGLSQDEVDAVTSDLASRSERLRTLNERTDKRARDVTVQEFRQQLAGIVTGIEANADMADPQIVPQFMAETDELMQNALDGHEGSAESKAELSINLRKLRTDNALSIGTLQQKARRDGAVRKIGGDVRSLVSEVSANPSNLGNALELLSQSITQTGSQWFNQEEEEDALQGGREDLIQSALDGYIARGQWNDMRELLNTPGIQASMTPTVQEDYRNRLIDYDNKQNEFAETVNTKLGVVERLLDRPLTANEKLLVAGIQITDDKVFTQSKGLRTEYLSQSKTFMAVRGSYQKVLASAKAANPSQANDIALVFAFMKMIDPTSVVRESEQASARNAANVPERLRAQYNSLLTTKGRFTQPQRDNFVDAAKNQYLASIDEQRNRQARYRDLAEKFSLDPADIVEDFTGEDDSGEDRATLSQEPDGETIMLDANGNPIGG